MEKTLFAACHLLRFSLDAALNSKKNLEKKNQLIAAALHEPAANTQLDY